MWEKSVCRTDNIFEIVLTPRRGYPTMASSLTKGPAKTAESPAGQQVGANRHETPVFREDTVGRPEGPTDPKELDETWLATRDRERSGEKKQWWPWDPVASGMWWIEALETSRKRRASNNDAEGVTDSPSDPGLED
jgi:hypothetical protein